MADDRLLSHVFTNLLMNAVKYSPPGATVHFDISRDGPEVVCVVRDRGIGIPELDLPWLFDAFHRGRNVGDRPGTGQEAGRKESRPTAQPLIESCCC